jgi:hypothetical protein
MIAATVSATRSDQSTATTAAPSRANCKAAARPIPDAAPVTSTVFP